MRISERRAPDSIVRAAIKELVIKIFLAEPKMLYTYNEKDISGQSVQELSVQLNDKLMKILALPEGDLEAIDQSLLQSLLAELLKDAFLWDSHARAGLIASIKALTRL